MNIDLHQGEQIKQIQGYPKYYITTEGRVYSEHSHRFLKPTASKPRGGHQREYISLGRGNKKYVHRLVAEAFLPNPDNLPEVDHIDTNGLNNNVNNLRWCDRLENINNPITKERISNNTGWLMQIENIETGEKYWGYKEASEKTGFSEGCILNHTKNKVQNPRYRLTGNKKKPE